MVLARSLDPPGSWRAFRQRFPTEIHCEQFLSSVRYPEGFRCPRCGSERGWPLRGQRLIECAEGHKISLTAGTVLHGTRQELMTWFHAAYLVATLTPGISALQFQHQLGLSRYQTAFEMLHKIRSVLVAPGRERLHGEVEVDETFIGGRDPDRDGRSGDKVLVVGAAEIMNLQLPKPKSRHQKAGRIRLCVVPDASASSVAGFVEREITAGSVVHTDGWDGYRRLRESGFDHRRHIQGKGRKAQPVLPHIHRVFANLKAWLRGTHHGRVEPRYLQAYLNEYTFRFNRRFWRGPAFLRVIMLLVQSPDIARPPDHNG
jgi:transposase-like protein